MAGTPNTTKPDVHVDIMSLLGVFVALGGILAGLVLEGGRIADVVQLTGALIVFGGTAGAVMLTTPFSIIRSSLRRLKKVLFEERNSTKETIEEILVYAGKARKNGMVSLEADAADIADPFLRKAVMLAVDGTELHSLRSMMELEMRVE